MKDSSRRGDEDTWAEENLATRRMVPRWHSPSVAAAKGERNSNLTGASKLPSRAARWVSQLESGLGLQNDPHLSVEIAESKFLAGAGSEIAWTPDLSRLQRLWASVKSFRADDSYVSPNPAEHAKAGVAHARASIKANPRQPLAWSELSRNHLILGQEARAVQAMWTALHLANGNAYITRSAARLFVQIQDPEQALYVIRRSSLAKADPRILAAEISIAESNRMKGSWSASALRMMADANYRPSFISDLTAAMATLEMSNGKHKRARQLFADSMHSPSENSLAQTQWASEKDHKIIIPKAAWDVPGSDEARALAARVRHDWDAVLDASECWLASEPFAARPAAMASFASFTEEQNKRSEKIASRALVSHPDDALLLNNRSVARAYSGDVSGALEDVSRALKQSEMEEDYPVFYATLGLAAYRGGDPATGRECYVRAIEDLTKEKRLKTAASASLFWIREEFRLNPSAPTTLAVFEQIKKAVPKITKGEKNPEIDSMLEYLDGYVGSPDLYVSVHAADTADTKRILDLANTYVPDRAGDTSPVDLVSRAI